MKTLKLGLCQGRHKIREVNHFIFPQEVNPLDTKQLARDAYDYLNELDDNVIGIQLYVTGLTVALIAALNAAFELGLIVTLYHYDRSSDSYYPQSLAWNDFGKEDE